MTPPLRSKIQAGAWALALCSAIVSTSSDGPSSGPNLFRRAAEQASQCIGGQEISKIFSNGARWRMCWQVLFRTGLTLDHVAYAPPGDGYHEVLGAASIAEIFVPYDSGEPRYFDVAGFGFGPNTRPLSPKECPNGRLHTQRRSPLVCAQTTSRGYAYRTSKTYAIGHELNVFSVARVSYYENIISWSFADDGTITARYGVSGTMPRIYTSRKYGWATGQGSSKFEESHTHDVYWRLDFDVDGRRHNAVRQYDFAGSGTARRALKEEHIRKERAVNFAPMRFWSVSNTSDENADGHAISWELDSAATAAYRGPPSESFTRHDLYITTHHSCEWVAAWNADGACQNSVARFVNGERLKDPVLWIDVSWHHVPRDEELAAKGTGPLPTFEWQSFQIRPRDLSADDIYK
jgi:primary-amine oxidase